MLPIKHIPYIQVVAEVINIVKGFMLPQVTSTFRSLERKLQVVRMYQSQTYVAPPIPLACGEQEVKLGNTPPSKLIQCIDR